MKTVTTIPCLLLLTMISCDFGKSVNMDFITGLSTRGDGLTCDDVYLSDGDKKLNRNSFTYGETFYLYFDNIKGFDKEENAAYPGMKLSVLDQEGDTVLKYDDMYAESRDGFDFSPLQLHANLTVADPIRSNTEYSLSVLIWDKKGNGKFHAEMDFVVIPNEAIVLDSKGISYDEIYLFSGDRNTTITGTNAGFNETIYLLFEGLEGFSEEGGMAFVGLSMKLTDANGNIILDEQDLIGDGGMDYTEFSSQLAPNFIISDTGVESPVKCEIMVWDKKGESSIRATVSMVFE